MPILPPTPPPLQPPIPLSPPPRPPGSSVWSISLSLTVQADAVDESALRQNLAANLPGITAADIRLIVRNSTGHRINLNLRSLQGSMTGGAILSVDVAIEAQSEFVVDSAVAALNEMIEEEAEMDDPYADPFADQVSEQDEQDTGISDEDKR